MKKPSSGPRVVNFSGLGPAAGRAVRISAGTLPKNKGCPSRTLGNLIRINNRNSTGED
jgi:hypothetical protein